MFPKNKKIFELFLEVFGENILISLKVQTHFLIFRQILTNKLEMQLHFNIFKKTISFSTLSRK